MKLLVAVYGSLRKGFGNHGLMNGAICLGTAEIPGFAMYSLGSFPGIMPDKGKEIFAEIYEITDEILERLDRLEGHPNFYKRELVDTSYGKVWIYILQNREHYAHLPVVESGEWGEWGESHARR